MDSQHIYNNDKSNWKTSLPAYPDLLKDVAADDSKCSEKVSCLVRHNENLPSHTSLRKPSKPEPSAPSYDELFPPKQQQQQHQPSPSLEKPKTKRKKTIFRVLCCFGWVFCCPCWSLGACLLERPNTGEDLRADPCYPCFNPVINTDTCEPHPSYMFTPEV